MSKEPVEWLEYGYWMQRQRATVRPDPRIRHNVELTRKQAAIVLRNSLELLMFADWMEENGYQETAAVYREVAVREDFMKLRKIDLRRRLAISLVSKRGG